jgi:hypothetical protein
MTTTRRESAMVSAGEANVLGTLLRGDVVRPEDVDYDSSRGVWNAMIDRRPAAIVRCRGVADVLAAVRFAHERGLPVSVRGGGHNVAGHAVGSGAVMVDLSAMRSVRVDPQGRRAWVEGGATWHEVDHETQAFGLAVPGGLISTTGVGGLTLSGGVGWLRSRHGLSVDNILAADVVTADGRLIRASATENSDLLWALRGGGGNFGIVTSFEFALHPVGPTLMFCAPLYPLSAGGEPIRFWRDFLADKSDDVASLVEFSTIPRDPDYPEKFWGQRIYTIAAVYAGDADEGERLLRPLRELGELVSDFSAQMSYCEIQSLFDTLMPSGQYRCYWKSHYLRGRDDSVIDEIIEGNGSAIAAHVVIDLELRRGDCQGRRRGHRIRRQVDALHVVARLHLGRRGAGCRKHRMDAQILAADEAPLRPGSDLPQLCRGRRGGRRPGASLIRRELRPTHPDQEEV